VRDTKLDREVAIKVLPAAVAQDRERLARFEREAKVLASLNHPNIAQIYGLEENGETRALVMEFVADPRFPFRSPSRPLCTTRDRFPKRWRRRTKRESRIGI
jgi:eukaryotic-like serine/threonine-protein kinase